MCPLSRSGSWLLIAGAALLPAGCFLGPEGTRPSVAAPAPAPGIREYRTLSAPEPSPAPAPLPAPPAPPALAAASAPAPVPVPAPAAGPTDPKELYRKAVDRYAAMDSYIARLRRCEDCNGTTGTPEIMTFTFRKAPWSVHFKWLEGNGKGREVVYVKGQHEDKIHTLLAAGDMPFAPAGKVISLAPDSILVRGRCRYPITEAGIGSLIDRFGQAVNYRDRNGNGTLRSLGRQKRPEYEVPLEVVEQTIAPGTEAVMADGGQRFWYFDPANGLPVLVITKDRQGKQVEYYCYDRLQFPVKLDDADFDPAKLWGKAAQ